MKKILLGVLLAAMLGAAQAEARDESFDNGALTFWVPDDYTPLTAEEIAAKYPSGRTPAYAVGNAARTSTIAYSLAPGQVQFHEMLALQTALTETYSRSVPGAQFMRNEIQALNGRQWLYIELTSSSPAVDIYNTVLVTPYKGELLMFNFNATKKDYKQASSDLRASYKSIRLKD